MTPCIESSRRLHVLALAVACLTGEALAQTTQRVSVATNGASADASALSPAISADGRYVAFVSRATNLDPSDGNGSADVWVRDLATGTTELVSRTSTGASGDRGSYQPSLSADGRHVAFTSFARNLVDGDRNDRNDVYVRDRRLGRTVRVSLDASGAEVRDHCEAPSISADGRHVAFHSRASTLVAGDMNGEPDVFVKDLATGAIERVSVGTGGVEGHGPAGARSAISSDGRFVAFTSDAPDLVAGDTNGDEDVFLRDRRLGTTVRVSVATDGTQGDFDAALASMSADARFVVFATRSRHLAPGDTNDADDVYVRDLLAATTERVSVGTGGVEGDAESSAGSISADGRHVAFASWSTNFATLPLPVRAQVYVRDRRAATTTLVSLSSAGTAGNDDSASPVTCADGRRIAFLSYASNLVPPDGDGLEDAYVRDRGAAPANATRGTNDARGAEGRSSAPTSPPVPR